jgi:hypothetical protein
MSYLSLDAQNGQQYQIVDLSPQQVRALSLR